MSKQVKSTKTKTKAASGGFDSDFATTGSGNSYFKPQDGDNKVRIITEPIEGWLAWVEEDDKKKPLRTTVDDEPDAADFEDDNKPKKFWALAVIDHEDGEVKIWEMTQQTIIKAIKSYAQNPDWGKPFGYDLNISKSGENLRTKYVVTPSPKKPLAKDLVKKAMEKPCNLDALYANEDPWAVDGNETEYHLAGK